MCKKLRLILSDILLRQDNQARFELFSDIFSLFNVIKVSPPCHGMQRKTLSMNRVSLNRESLDHVS